MALIERTSIGTATASASDAVITWLLDGSELGRANPLAYIDIALPETTVLSSVQGKVTAIDKPKQPPYSFSSIGPVAPEQGEGPTVLEGIQFMMVDDWFNQKYHFIGLAEAMTILGSTETQRLLGSIPLGTVDSPAGGGIIGGSNDDILRRVGKSPNLYRYPTDGSIHYIVTVLRPGWRGRVPTFLNSVIVWYPYSLTFEVTGYVLNEHEQTPPDEQVTAVVQDAVCNELYGFRPAKEEQSDFIENQKQCIRVGEYILWQAQLVLATDFQVPFNPAIKRGMTIRVQNADKSIDILGLVKDVSHTIRVGQQGGQGLAAVTNVTLRSGEYVFRSALGENDDQEVVDRRQLE